jgi:hypothetical protein
LRAFGARLVGESLIASNTSIEAALEQVELFERLCKGRRYLLRYTAGFALSGAPNPEGRFGQVRS